MFNIWHDIDLMQAVSRFVSRVALLMLLLAGIAWALQLPYFAINQFRFVGDVKQVDEKSLHDSIEKHLLDGFSGGFFSIALKNVQSSLSETSWIKSASIRRVWPHEVEITLEAHEPIAVWGERYLSVDGQLFDVSLAPEVKQSLLVTSGPDVASPLVAEKIPVFQQWLSSTGWKIIKVHLSERYSWRLGLSNGLEIEFGRSDTPTALVERANRLVKSSHFIEASLGHSGGYVDLRYPNGFAMRTDKLHRLAAVNNVNIGETK